MLTHVFGFWWPSLWFLSNTTLFVWYMGPAASLWSEKSHQPGWGTAGTLGRMDASPVPAKETTANSFSYRSVSVSHICGVPVLAEGMKPTLASCGIHISGFTPGERGQRGYSQRGTPCPLHPVTWCLLTNSTRAGQAIHRILCASAAFVGRTWLPRQTHPTLLRLKDKQHQSLFMW